LVISFLDDRKMLFLKSDSKTNPKKIASFFIIFSAKLKIKGKRNGKEWCEILGALNLLHN